MFDHSCQSTPLWSTFELLCGASAAAALLLLPAALRGNTSRVCTFARKLASVNGLVLPKNCPWGVNGVTQNAGTLRAGTAAAAWEIRLQRLDVIVVFDLCHSNFIYPPCRTGKL